MQIRFDPHSSEDVAAVRALLDLLAPSIYVVEDDDESPRAIQDDEAAMLATLPPPMPPTLAEFLETPAKRGRGRPRKQAPPRHVEPTVEPEPEPVMSRPPPPPPPPAPAVERVSAAAVVPPPPPPPPPPPQTVTWDTVSAALAARRHMDHDTIRAVLLAVGINLVDVYGKTHIYPTIIETLETRCPL